MRAFMGLIALTFIALPVVAYETQSQQTDRTAVEAAIAEDQAVAIAAIEPGDRVITRGTQDYARGKAKAAASEPA